MLDLRKTFLSTEVCAINITIGNAPRQRPRCVLHVKPMTVDEIIAALKSTSAAPRAALLVGLAHADKLAPGFYAVAGKFCQGIHFYRPTVWSKVIYAMQDRSQRTMRPWFRQENQETLRFRRTAAGAIIRSRSHTKGVINGKQEVICASPSAALDRGTTEV